MVKSLAINEIDRIHWSRLREVSGSAENIPSALNELFSALTPSDVEIAYWKLENHVVVQGQLYEVAQFVVPVLLAALAEERPRHVRICILELLFQIVSGEADETELRVGNIDLVTECRARAREGLWILYRELVFGEREAAREVIDVIETDLSRLAYFLENSIKPKLV